MPAANKFNQFTEDVFSGVHQLQTGTSHVLKVVLSNVAPAATDEVLASITQIANGNGYTTGGLTIGTLTGTQASGLFKLTNGTQPTWTATPASMATFRYIVLYNDTPTSPADPLIAWYDRGSTLTLGVGETFTVNFDTVSGILTCS